MEVPLMQLGPSQTYGTAYFASTSHTGTRIVAVEGGSLNDSPPPTQHARPRTLLDRLFRINRIYYSVAAAASNTWSATTFARSKKQGHFLHLQLINLVTNIDGTVHPTNYKTNQLALFTRFTAKLRKQQHESHAKTTRSPRTHQENSYHKWVLSDNARTSGRTRRKQGHSLRAGRGINSKRRTSPRSQQSTLFVDC